MRYFDKHATPLGLYLGKWFLLQTCRPDGAVPWEMVLATNMSPRWGCTLVNDSCYKYITPLGLYLGIRFLLQICHPAGAVPW